MSDIEIARKATLRPLAEVAAKIGIPEAAIEPYGRAKAKIDVGLLPKSAKRG